MSTVNYARHVIRNRPGAVKTAFHKYWGGIGDFVYFLAFVGPAIDAEPNYRHVLVADVYNRYHGDPLFDLCVMHDRFDELWTYPRKGGGAKRWPTEAVRMAQENPAAVKVYAPGMYFIGGLSWWPAPSQYDVIGLREIAKAKPMGLMRDCGDGEFFAKRPYLTDSHKVITVQPRTSGKPSMNVMSPEAVKRLSALGHRVVIIFSPPGARKYDVAAVAGLPGVTVEVTPRFTDAVRIMSKSDVHVGVESCLAMVAMVFGKPLVTLKVFGLDLGHFLSDLSVMEITELPYDVTPEKIALETSVWLS